MSSAAAGDGNQAAESPRAVWAPARKVLLFIYSSLMCADSRQKFLFLRARQPGRFVVSETDLAYLHV